MSCIDMSLLKKSRLGELIEVTRGASLSGEYYSTKGEYIRLTCGNFDYHNNCFKENTSKDNLFYTGEFREEFLLEKGDIITPLTEQAIGLLGTTARIPKSGKYIQSQDIALVKCKAGKIDPTFCYYLISSRLVRNQLSAAAQQTKIRHTSPDKIKACTVWVPELDEQITIGRLLASLDDKIHLNKRINDNLEAMARQLYDYWFVQFDFPNEEGKPYKSSGGAMVWNDKLKREIPSCFEVVNMGDLCNFKNGINYSKDEIGNDYQIVNVRNISSSRILLDGEDFDVITVPTSKAENYVLKPDDIIIARSGCPGSTRLLLSATNTLFCGFIICCTPNDSSMRNYLVYCLKQLEGTTATNSGGSILQNVSQDTLKGLHVIVPEKQIIDKFNKTIELIFARMLNCLKESKALTKQRDELLPLLMNGQATVNYHLLSRTMPDKRVATSLKIV